MIVKIVIILSFFLKFLTAQELCPVEDISVIEGDSQNIIMWDEPVDPFLSTLTIEITTDSYGSETSWTLEDNNGVHIDSISNGTLSSNTTYTWENDSLPQGTYIFTLKDSYGDGLFANAGMRLFLNGNIIDELVGANGDEWSEYEVIFNTDAGWFGTQSYTYSEPHHFEKGVLIDYTIIESFEIDGPHKIASGNFNVLRDVPEVCGLFVEYKVYNAADGTVIGNTTELEFSHFGLTNGTTYSYYVVAVYDVNGTLTESVASNTVSGTPNTWVAEAPTNLMAFPGDEQVLLSWYPPSSSGGGDGLQGDKIENPFIVTGLPFTVQGSTATFNNDYDVACAFTGSTAKDVVYLFATSGGFYDFSLCGDSTDYDTKLYILDADENVIEGSFPSIEEVPEDQGFACNDDACSTESYDFDFVSAFSGYLSAGIYYVIVDGYGSSSGNYTLDISLSTEQLSSSEDIYPDFRNRTEYDFAGYNVYVENVKDNTNIVESLFYFATELENGLDYTFGVTAVYDGPIGGEDYESEMITIQSSSTYLSADITGVIKDPNGAPLEGAIVSGDGLSDTTGTNGVYMLAEIPVGEIQVMVSIEGFSSEIAIVNVLNQAEPTVQDFVLFPDMPTPLALTASAGDEKVYLAWKPPGSEVEYDIAYYDDNFEAEIGCNGGGCPFGVRLTPASYPATLQNVVISIQPSGTASTASIEAYLDPSGSSNGPTGQAIELISSIDLSTSATGTGISQFSLDVSDLDIVVESGDIYIVVNEPLGSFLSLANDIQPFSQENLSRNWIFLEDYYTGEAEWLTIAEVLEGTPYYSDLTGDFGILGSFLGVASTISNASFAVNSSSSSNGNNSEVALGNIANYNNRINVNQLNNGLYLIEGLYNVNPIPPLNTSQRDGHPDLYNIYLVSDDLTSTLVSTTTDTSDTIFVDSNYSNYCFNVKAQYDTGEPSDGGYGIIESRPSNTACAVPYAVGDSNFDSDITIEDVLTLVDFILEEITPSSAAFNNSDVNMDGELNIADVVMVVDIISGSSTLRAVNNGSFASLDLIPNYNTSDLTVNLSYNGGLKGLEFDIEYDSEALSLSAPSLVVMQENVVSTFNHLEEGLIKVVVFDASGGFIIPNENNDLLKMSFNFFGDLLDESSVNINNVIVSGPKGNIANVSSNVVSAAIKLIPGVFALHQNYPNPFNPNTEIRFDIPDVTKVDISIYNLMGQRVKTLKNEKMTPGYHTVLWDGTNDNGVQVSTGMYFYTLQTEAKSAMRKMLFLK